MILVQRGTINVVRQHGWLLLSLFHHVLRRQTRTSFGMFVDYDKASGNEPVVLNIDVVYFLQFNQAKGMNIDTGEKRDEVTVTEDSCC
jgi:hypothetical protein